MLFFRDLITDKNVKLKYQHLITNSFVQVKMIWYHSHVGLSKIKGVNNPNFDQFHDVIIKVSSLHLSCQSNSLFRWCPAPDCHHVIKVEYKDRRPVVCNCGKEFCFECGEAWHDPVLCAVRWNLILLLYRTISLAVFVTAR